MNNRRRRNPRDPRKKRRHFHKWLIPLLALLLLPVLLLAYLNFNLNKINRKTPQKSIDPAIETLDKRGFEDLFKDADKNIRDNVSDNLLWYHEDVYNVLLAGLDYGGKEGFKDQYYPRADALLLVSANRHTRVVTVVSLSRASYVAIPGFANGRINLGHAYGGAKLLVQTVEHNYKVRVDAFMTVDFDGFVTLIDIMGGVNITLDQAEYDALAAAFQLGDGPGTYLLNGGEALAYARLRYIDSDRARTERQRKILRQLASETRRLSMNQIRDCINGILPLVTTDLGNLELMSLLPYAGYRITEAVIPRKAVPLTVVNGQEVLLLNWSNVRSDVHDLLYPGMIPAQAAGS
ncbi:MAG: LCP family protein [Oscillospiraceae bacterium]|jgi:LCP family protein required for cell wall assembly|nr:LCP family protein [Oscillospiraceae bacterium]